MTPDRADADIEDTLRSAPGFDALPVEMLRELTAEASVVTLENGQSVHVSHHYDGDLYVVVSGVLTVSGPNGALAEMTLQDLGRGALVGGVSLASPDARLSIRARGPAVAGTIPRRAFEQFVSRHPEHGMAVLEALKPSLRRERLWLAMGRTDAFQNLDTEALSELELVPFYSGEVVVREGEAGDDLWIVVTGRLRVVTTDANGSESALAELALGETVGDMAMISREPRSATVYAIRDSLLAKLSSAAFYRLLERRPRSGFDLVATKLVARLRSRSQRHRPGNSVATIALIPAAPDAPIGAIGERLAGAFSRLGPTLRLTSDAVDRYLGASGAAQSPERDGGAGPLVEWLASREMEHRYVLYQADPALSPWTERCARHADY
ncbi:MAG: cyclic nucleotide-binding domain-containing protein, partial [Vicinamibacterales bacterium]